MLSLKYNCCPFQYDYNIWFNLNSRNLQELLMSISDLLSSYTIYVECLLYLANNKSLLSSFKKKHNQFEISLVQSNKMFNHVYVTHLLLWCCCTCTLIQKLHYSSLLFISNQLSKQSN